MLFKSRVPRIRRCAWSRVAFRCYRRLQHRRNLTFSRHTPKLHFGEDSFCVGELDSVVSRIWTLYALSYCSPPSQCRESLRMWRRRSATSTFLLSSRRSRSISTMIQMPTTTSNISVYTSRRNRISRNGTNEESVLAQPPPSIGKAPARTAAL